MIRRGPIFRALSAVLLVTTTACVSWRPYEGTPADAPHQVRMIRLHLTSGETVPLKDAFIVGDSMWVGNHADAPSSQMRILLTEVQGVEEAHYRLAGTRGKVVAGALMVGLLVLIGVEIGKNGLGIKSLGGS